MDDRTVQLHQACGLLHRSWLRWGEHCHHPSMILSLPDSTSLRGAPPACCRKARSPSFFGSTLAVTSLGMKKASHPLVIPLRIVVTSPRATKRLAKRRMISK
jgi:hypothetical protein